MVFGRETAAHKQKGFVNQTQLLDCFPWNYEKNAQVQKGSSIPWQPHWSQQVAMAYSRQKQFGRTAITAEEEEYLLQARGQI